MTARVAPTVRIYQDHEIHRNKCLIPGFKMLWLLYIWFLIAIFEQGFI